MIVYICCEWMKITGSGLVIATSRPHTKPYPKMTTILASLFWICAWKRGQFARKQKNTKKNGCHFGTRCISTDEELLTCFSEKFCIQAIAFPACNFPYSYVAAQETVTTSVLSGSKTLKLTATLSGGKGDVAWQQAQLFSQPIDSENIAFDFTVVLRDP